MTDIDIQNLRYDRKEVGKRFSSSKILHTWEFNLNKKYHKISFYDSRLSYKRKIILDDSVLFYDKDASEFFTYEFFLAGIKFEIIQTDVDKYDIEIDGRRFKKYMSDERNGTLEQLREEKEIDEYNERALKYNGSNYYEGMEYQIMEREREREEQREREREREKEREREENEEGESDEDDEIFDDFDVNQIKKNIEKTMNKTGRKQNNNNNINFFENDDNNNVNNQNQFVNNNMNNFYNNGNNNSNNNFFNFGNNNNINKGNNEFNFGFTNNNNSNQYPNNYGNNFNNNEYNNNYNNRINFNNRNNMIINNNFNNNNFNQGNFNNNSINFNTNSNINNYYNNTNKNNNNSNYNSNQFDTMDNSNTNITQTDSFFNTNLSRIQNNESRTNNFKEEIMKSGLVNLNNLFEEPKNKNNNSEKNYENIKFRNNDDSFDF